MLIRAVENNSYKMVKILIDAGVDVNYDPVFPIFLFLKMRKGFTKTALHYAAENNYLDIAVLLIQSGAKKYMKGNNTKTPFDLVTTDKMRNVFKHIGKSRRR
jgi:ankyrin repeat protein